jgi:hypothetical protein
MIQKNGESEASSLYCTKEREKGDEGNDGKILYMSY